MYSILCDDLCKTAGSSWMREAIDRNKWRDMGIKGKSLK